MRCERGAGDIVSPTRIPSVEVTVSLSSISTPSTSTYQPVVRLTYSYQPISLSLLFLLYYYYSRTCCSWLSGAQRVYL